MKLLYVYLEQVLRGCPRLPDALGKFLRVALAYPLEEFTLPASIAFPQDQYKDGISLGATDTQLGSCLEGLH